VKNHAEPDDKPHKYLLVDDHAGFRKTVRDFLPGQPVEVVECSEGREALAAYTYHLPDWTLIDVEMPELDGLRATRSIRAQFPRARIIILTEHDLPELRGEARAAGAIAYVLKDRLRDLPAVITSLLQDSPPSPNKPTDSAS
jgi:DNA-binding NarL/FixJ family response regulator